MRGDGIDEMFVEFLPGSGGLVDLEWPLVCLLGIEDEEFRIQIMLE